MNSDPPTEKPPFWSTLPGIFTALGGFIVALTGLLALLIPLFSQPHPTPTLTSTPSPTATPTLSPTLTPTPTLSPAGVTPTPNPKATPERPTIHKEFYVLTGIQRPLSSKLDYNRGSDGDQENIVLTHFVEEHFDKFIGDAEEGLGITISYQNLPPLSNNTVSVGTITGANVTEFISNIQTKLKTGNMLYSVKRTTKMTYRLSPK